MATCFNNIACTLKNLARPEEAFSMHKKSMLIKKKLLGEDNPEVAVSLDNMASILYDMGRFELALQIYNEVLKIRLNRQSS